MTVHTTTTSAPRDSALYNAPDPEHKSKNEAPTTRDPQTLKTDSRTIALVGRNDRSFEKTNARR